MTMTKNAIGNLINRYRAVLKKCNLINLFGSLAVAGMMVGVMNVPAGATGDIIINSNGTTTLDGGTNTYSDTSFTGVNKSGTYGTAINSITTQNVSSTTDAIGIKAGSGVTISADSIGNGINITNSGTGKAYALYSEQGGTITLGEAGKSIAITGGIYAKDSDSQITVTGDANTINGSADIGAGATLNITNTTINNGSADIGAGATLNLTNATINNSLISSGTLNLTDSKIVVTDSSVINETTEGSSGYKYNNAITLSNTAILKNVTIEENFADNNTWKRVRGIYVKGTGTVVNVVTEGGKTSKFSFDRDKVRSRSQTGWSYGISLGDGSDADNASMTFSGAGNINISGNTTGGGDANSPYGYSINGIRVNGINNNLTFSNTGKTTITESGMYGVNGVVNYGTTKFTAGTVLINSYIDGGVAFSNNIGLYNSGYYDPSYINVTNGVEEVTIFIEGAGYDAKEGSGDISNGAAAIYESSNEGTTIINAKKLNILAVSGEDTNKEWTIGGTTVTGHTTYSAAKVQAVGSTKYSTTYGILNDYIGKIVIGSDTITNIHTRDFHKNSFAVAAMPVIDDEPYTEGNSSIEILGNTTIVAEGSTGTLALYANKSGSITVGSTGKTVNITGDILSTGSYDDGDKVTPSTISISGSTNTIAGVVTAQDAGIVNLKNTDITGGVVEERTGDKKSYGTVNFIGANTVNGKVILYHNINMTTSSDSLSFITGTATEDKIEINGDVSVSGTNSSIDIAGTATAIAKITGSVNVGSEAKMTLSHTKVDNLLTNTGNLTLSGNNTFGGGLQNGNTVTVTDGNTSITSFNQTAGSTTVARDATLTLSGTNSTANGSTLTNNGTLTASGTNTLNGNMSNAGSLTISGGSTTLTEFSQTDGSTTIDNGAALTASLEKITGGTMTNNGTFNMSGDLSRDIDGTGETILQNNISVAADRTVNGTLNLNGKTIDMIQSDTPQYTTLSAGALTGTGDLKINTDFATQKADVIKITSTGSNATINVSDVKMLGYSGQGGKHDNYFTYLITDTNGDLSNITTTVGGSLGKIVTTDGVYTYVFTQASKGILSLEAALVSITLPEYIIGNTVAAQQYTSYNVNENLSLPTIGTTGNGASRVSGYDLKVNLNNGKKLSGDGTGTGIEILKDYTLTLDGSSASGAAMSLYKTALQNAGTLNVNSVEFTGNGTDINNTGTLNFFGTTDLNDIFSQDGGKTVVDSTANLELANATFQNKAETVSGSAIENNGTVEFTATTIFQANKGTDGAALKNSGTVTFNENTLFTSNTGSDGGAVYNTSTGTINFNAPTVFTENSGTGSGDSINNDGIINLNSTMTFNSTKTNPVDIFNEGTVNVNVDSYTTLSEGSTAYKDDNQTGSPKLVFKGGTLIADFDNFLKNEAKDNEHLAKNPDLKTTISDTTEGGTMILRSLGAFGSTVVEENKYYSAQLKDAKNNLGLSNALLSFKDATLQLLPGEDIIAEQQEDAVTIKNISVVTENTTTHAVTDKVTDIYDTGIAKITTPGTTNLATADTVKMESSNFSVSSLQVNPSSEKVAVSAVDSSVTFSGESLVVDSEKKAVKTELTIGGNKTDVASGGSSTVIIAGNMKIDSIKADGNQESSLLVVNKNASLTTDSIETKENAEALEVSVAGTLAAKGAVQAKNITAASDASTKATIEADSVTAQSIEMTNASLTAGSSISAENVTAKATDITAKTLNLSGSMQISAGSSVMLDNLDTSKAAKDNQIVILVGSDTAAKGGDSLVVASMKLSKYAHLLVDPAWDQAPSVVAVENIGESSTMGDIILTGRAGVGQNSMLTVGSTDDTWLSTCLKDATGSNQPVENVTTAAFGLYNTLDLSGDDSGVLVVNGSLSENGLGTAVATAEAGSAIFADKSFFAVNGNIAGTSSDNAALKANTITVGDNAKLYVSNVSVARKYYIANASNSLSIASGSWDDDNLKIDNSLLSASLNTDKNSAWLEVCVNDISIILPKLDPALARAANTLIAMDGNGGLDSDNYAARFINRASTNIADKTHAAATIEGSAKLAFAGAVPQMNLDLAQRMNNALTSRDFLSSAPGIGAAAGNTDNGFALWALPTYQYSNGDGFKSGNFKSGYEANVGGMALGGDYTLNNSLRLGLAINGGGGKVETDGGDYNETKNDINYIGVNAYASWKLNNFSLFGQIGFLRTNNDLSQKTPSEMNMADSKADDVHSTVFTLGMRASYQFTTKWIDIIPYIGLDYYNVHTSAFAVKSDGFAMFNGDNIDANYLQIPVGVNMKKVLTEANGWNVKAALDLSVIPNIGSHKATQDIRLQGLSTNANIGHVITDECTGRAIVGIEAKRGNLGLGLNYSFQGGNHTTNHGVQGMVNWKF